jgi:hypothetical protein
MDLLLLLSNIFIFHSAALNPEEYVNTLGIYEL